MNIARQIRRRRERRGTAPPVKPKMERVFAVAIMRGEKLWDGGRGSHSQLRRSLDPACADPYNTVPGDTDGFIVSPSGRFVDRMEARKIAAAAGQAQASERELLSSDLNW